MLPIRNILFAILLFINGSVVSQPSTVENNLPEVGFPCPDFELSDMHYFTSTHAKLSDFKGKWLLLDFFTTGCSSCFQQMPAMKQLQEEFTEKIQFVYVGLNDGRLPKTYERYQEKYQLHFPVAYDSDHKLFDKFGIFGVPHIVLVNKDGIVKAITDKLTRDELVGFLEGNDPQIVRKLYESEFVAAKARFNPLKPLLIDGNGGKETDFLFRSVLTQFNGDVFQLGILSIKDQYSYTNPDNPKGDRIIIKGRVQIIGYPLIELYRLAFGDTVGIYPFDNITSYGKWWSKPILKMTDSSDFIYDYRTSNRNLYNYSLIVPPDKSSAKFLQQCMQRDLQNYFGYNVSVETRLMPYWKVKVLQGKQLPLTNNKIPPRTGFRLINEPITELIQVLYLTYQDEIPLLLDESSLDTRISVEAKTMLGDFEEARTDLLKNGIILTKQFKPMKVIIIGDK